MGSFQLVRALHSKNARSPMENTVPLNVHRLGYWSAVFASIFSITYVVGQLAEWLALLGSAGGPESPSTLLGIVVLLTPSLFLGSAFLLLMVSLHHAVPDDRRIWTQAALVFATIYCALISINYFVQLTLVAPHMAHGEIESVRFLLFTPFDSFLYSVDILGYGFMSVATLLGAFALTGTGLERLARRFLIGNGLLLPFITLQNFY